jgi:N-acetylglutamate synthase-like GNAT family acetyltransferase
MIIERVVVHPAYWRRSHGKTLVNWGLALAETDKIKTGVVANTVGVGLYLALGFMRIEMVKLEDEEEPPNALEGVILRYDV